MAESENFAKRAAVVFGALDRCIPSKHPEPTDDRSSKQQQSVQVALENTCTVRASYVRPSIYPSQEAKPLREKRVCSEGSSTSKAKRPKAWDPIRSDFHTHRKPQNRRPAKAPDFVRNPGKWAKYSLADDGTNELKGLTADQVNKHVALQFLDEIKNRKSLEQSMGSSDDLMSSQPKPVAISQKVLFSRPKATFAMKKDRKDDSKCDEMSDGTRCRSQQISSEPYIKRGSAGAGVIRMPEYEVGGKTATKKKLLRVGMVTGEERGKHIVNYREKLGTSLSITPIALSHLHDDEGDDDDDDDDV